MPQTTKNKMQDIFGDADVEDAALAALDDDYVPSKPNGDEDTPSLNDSIPIDSDDLEDEEDNTESEELENGEIDESEELGEEWDGEKN